MTPFSRRWSTTADVIPTMSRPGRRRAGRLRAADLYGFAAAYALYTAARWIFVGDLETAQTHAAWVLDLEHGLGIAVEDDVQSGVSTGVAWSLSNVYLAAQLVVLPGSLVWLYRRSRPVYRALRNTILATWIIAVPIFAAFPVAPPRLAEIGLDDTVSSQAVVALTGQSTFFYNLYAAVPSLHVGFAFAIGIAIYAALTAPWARLLALFWGPLVTLSVVSTGITTCSTRWPA